MSLGQADLKAGRFSSRLLLSPIEQTSKEVLSAVLALGGKKAASKKLKIPVQTITKLINESFPGGVTGDTARSARIKFDQRFLKLPLSERRNISQFATAMRKLMSPKDIQKMKDNPDKFAGAERFKKLVKALRSNIAKGYGVRLATQSPKDKDYYKPRIVLQVHRPTKTRSKKRARTKPTKPQAKRTAKPKTISRNRRRSGQR